MGSTSATLVKRSQMAGLLLRPLGHGYWGVEQTEDGFTLFGKGGKAQGSQGETRLVTAPHVDCERYLEGMAWKRKVHQENETILIETFSYEQVEGRLTEALAEKIAPHVSLKPISQDQVFDTLTELGQVDAFTQTLATFLRHFKSSGTTIGQCEARSDDSSDTARSKAFLKIFKPLIEAYQKRLEDRIDFEDMIVRAAEHVEAGRYKSPYRHLLVDEFQDISEGRARLLKALKAQHDDARLFAVGDDWQSIYRLPRRAAPPIRLILPMRMR